MNNYKVIVVLNNKNLSLSDGLNIIEQVFEYNLWAHTKNNAINMALDKFYFYNVLIEYSKDELIKDVDLYKKQIECFLLKVKKIRFIENELHNKHYYDLKKLIQKMQHHNINNIHKIENQLSIDDFIKLNDKKITYLYNNFNLEINCTAFLSSSKIEHIIITKE